MLEGIHAHTCTHKKDQQWEGLSPDRIGAHDQNEDASKLNRNQKVRVKFRFHTKSI